MLGGLNEMGKRNYLLEMSQYFMMGYTCVPELRVGQPWDVSGNLSSKNS
jgi:hypothetical protein